MSFGVLFHCFFTHEHCLKHSRAYNTPPSMVKVFMGNDGQDVQHDFCSVKNWSRSLSRGSAYAIVKT